MSKVSEKALEIVAEAIKAEIRKGNSTWHDTARAVLEAVSSIHEAEPVDDWSFQQRVGGWMLQCFTPEITADKLERNDRFIEEALELVQSLDYSAERAHALVDYVFGRAKGEPSQEVGGVMVTLAALCNPNGLNMDMAAETELARILAPEIVLKIRAKQASKPTGSALPVPVAHPAPISKGVTVKALEWGPKSGLGFHRAPSACGEYVTHEDLNRRGVYVWWVGNQPRGTEFYANSVEEAKAAAQADFDARILSCLSHTAGEIE